MLCYDDYESEMINNGRYYNEQINNMILESMDGVDKLYNEFKVLLKNIKILYLYLPCSVDELYIQETPNILFDDSLNEAFEKINTFSEFKELYKENIGIDLSELSEDITFSISSDENNVLSIEEVEDTIIMNYNINPIYVSDQVIDSIYNSDKYNSSISSKLFDRIRIPIICYDEDGDDYDNVIGLFIHQIDIKKTLSEYYKTVCKDVNIEVI